MDSNAESRTSATLLQRIQDPNDSGAWSEFMKRYAHLIHDWCRKMNLQDCDAHEVTQQVLIKLMGAIRTFQYDPSRSFRSYLRRVTHNAWVDFLKGRKEVARGSGDSEVHRRLAEVAAPDQLAELLYDREVLELAIERVKANVTPVTWDAFWLVVFERRSARETAERLGIEVARVYEAKSRVKQRLENAISELNNTEEGS